VSVPPEVTVVIPTRSRWGLLSANALPAALRQDDVEVEVIVVDDCSADETPRRLAEMRDPRVRLVRFEAPRGVAAARNAGITAARGQWLAFLDDDDIWSPRKLRAQLDAAERTQADFVYTAAAAVDADRCCLYALPPFESSRLATALLTRNVMWGGCSNVAARTAVLRALGGFDERLFQLCDWDLWIRLAHTARGASVNEVLVGCLHHEQSMLLTSRPDVFREFDYLVAKHEASARVSGVAFDRAAFTRWVAAGHRRGGRRSRAARLYLDAARHARRPTDVVRAVGALLGERSFEFLRALRPGATNGDRRGPEPAWLALYR
jgi:glycosyltransferase involved in cell wall biosynthesis